MNDLPEVVQRYLKKYSIEGWVLESNLTGGVNNAVVIPVICEYENLRNLLRLLVKNDNTYFEKTIIIIVVNNFPDSDDQVKHDNQTSLTFLREILSSKASDDSLVNEIKYSTLKIGCVDAASTGLEVPQKIGGVGLARKVGMDAALRIFNYNSTSKKILINLDADCNIDFNYLTAIISEFNKRNLSSAVTNFRHILDENAPTAPAIVCYELFLRYYVLGLKYAKSPFAFYTIGSTMICDHESYINVEGMNKRKAAEDFYFLEKLAKNYKIEKINSTTVYPSARSSWRVPFGTGQRVRRFLSHIQNEYLLYDPFCFDILKNWLQVFNFYETKNSIEYLAIAREIHSELANFLCEQNFGTNWEQILNNSRNSVQLSIQKNRWFDGFRTLKLIHYLRDRAFPQINTFEALNGLLKRLEINKDFYWRNMGIPNFETQKKYLELLRELT
jgi:hypothetical protein